MKKGKIVVFLLVCMLVGTVVFAESVSVQVGTGYTAIKSRDPEGDKDVYTGYEISGSVLFSKLPKLTVNVGYQNLLNVWDGDEYGYFDELTITGEYKILAKPNYGFSVKAGWLNKRFTDFDDPDERIAGNLLTIGGKGNLRLTGALQAIADATYAKNFFKTDYDDDVAIVTAKLGAEYELAKVPGLKLGVYYLFDKVYCEYNYWSSYAYVDYISDERSGFDLAASYEMSF